MQNLNPVINFFTKASVLLYIFVIIFLLSEKAICQTEQALPTPFQNLSINSKALEKTFEVTINENSSQATQNFALDKTGFILFLGLPPENSKIKVFLEDGVETETFNFTDGSIFSLADPQKNYFIVQEVTPNCDRISKAFNLDPTVTICPDSIAYKVSENIMLTKDTIFNIAFNFPKEFYQANLTLPENTIQVDKDFKSVKITEPDTTSTTENTTNPSAINIASLLSKSKLCIISRTKPVPKDIQVLDCSFKNKNVQTIITFKKDLETKLGSTQNIKLVFSFLSNTFKALKHNLIFTYNEEVKTENPQVKIDKTSSKQFFFESYTNNINLNLGQILKLKTKIKKNTFSLNNSIQIDNPLNKIIFNIPLTNKLEAIINPFSNQTQNSFLADLAISGKEKSFTKNFNITVNNNIVVQNLQEPALETSTPKRLQLTPQDFLKISSYTPEAIFDLDFNRTYTSVEQVEAPSVDANGKPIQVINNKSLIDLVLSKSFPIIDLTNPTSEITLDIEKTSNLLNNQSFKAESSLSGFLIPPDFRPVLEPNYRATIQFSMTINLPDKSLLTINYSDLKTKDETPLANFYKFSFLPLGVYQADLKFDGDRIKLFQTAGVVNQETK